MAAGRSFGGGRGGSDIPPPHTPPQAAGGLLVRGCSTGAPRPKGVGGCSEVRWDSPCTCSGPRAWASPRGDARIPPSHQACCLDSFPQEFLQTPPCHHPARPRLQQNPGLAPRSQRQRFLQPCSWKEGAGPCRKAAARGLVHASAPRGSREAEPCYQEEAQKRGCRMQAASSPSGLAVEPRFGAAQAGARLFP